MLTREQFQRIYDDGQDAVYLLFAAMHQQIDFLTARVKELEERLDKDSHNSHKPPSSDGYSKKPVSLRPHTGRKSGGQRGHEGSTLALSATPDTVVFHTSLACGRCGTALDPASAQETGQRRQVLDLPPLRLVVTEPRLASHAPTAAALPSGPPNPPATPARTIPML